MSIYADLEKEFDNVMISLNNKFQLLNIATSAEKNNSEDSQNDARAKELIKEIEKILPDVQDLLKQLDVEIRTLPQNQKKVFITKMMDNRTTYNSFQSKYQVLKEKSLRVSLMDNSSIDQRNRMLTLNDKLTEQNNRIYQAHIAVHGAEETANEIISELGRNREAIEGIKEKTSEFTGFVETADKQVASMQRRANREKNCSIS